MAEKLSFILTTLLSDVAILSDSTSQMEIVSCQLEVLQRISEAITDALKNPPLADQHKKGRRISLFTIGSTSKPKP